MATEATVQIRTARPDGTDKRQLGQSGHVVGLSYSDSLPGGSESLTCTVQASPARRDPAWQIGRQVRIYAGGQRIWDGELDEPVPGQDGWQLTAHGAGTFGAQYKAWWSSTWASGGAPSNAIDLAIGRGLRWVNGGSLNPLPAGAWLGQTPDNGSLGVDEMLNLICSRGGLTWQVKTSVAGNVLSVIPLPTKVTRLLVATSPIARTIAEVVTAIRVRYQNSNGTTPGYTTTLVTDDALAALYGTKEQYLDLSSGGLDSSGSQAIAVCNQVFKRYQQATWAGPFTVQPGQYLSTTGTPVSLCTEKSGEVVRVLSADYGGQVDNGLPSTFIVGKYEYDEDSGTAQITPFGSYRTDWQSLVARFTQYRTSKDDPFGLKT